jgi:hypothetical protein
MLTERSVMMGLISISLSNEWLRSGFPYLSKKPIRCGVCLLP